MNDLATLMGDGDGPAIKGPGIVVARKTTGDVKVGREGIVVTLTIGNSLVRMKYQDAMKIGQWMLNKAYEAKVCDGNNKRILIEKR